MYTLARIQSDHENLFPISKPKNFNQKDKDYRSLYGLSKFQMYILFSYFDEIIHPVGYDNVTPKHIMWTLYFLKNYPLRLSAAKVFRISEKTFDRYVWYCINLILGANNVRNVDTDNLHYSIINKNL